MYVPDNYDQFRIEERRMYDASWICEYCGKGFTDDEMSDDMNYCEACYNELKQFEEDENNEV